MSKVNENVVFLDRGNYTSCTIHLHGGTILSYRVKNKEILYMKKKATFNKFSPIRGGIKFTFPYFGKRSNGPKHGFARYVPWTLEEGPTTKKDGNVEVLLSLEESEYTKAIWNFKFKISFRLTLCISELRIAVKVENTSNHYPFQFMIMRHSIFQVMDVTKCEIYGLTGCKFMPVYSDTEKPIDQKSDGRDKIVIDRGCLDLYLDAPDEVEVRHIDDEGIKLKIKSTDYESSDVLLYNPWTMQTSTNYIPEEYLHFLGVGNGHISSDIRLEPREYWESQYVIEVLDEQNEQKMIELTELLDNPLLLFKESCKKTDLYSDESH